MFHLAFFESRGVVYREAGQAQDGLAILKHSGVTCARLRLFTSSAAQAQVDPYNYINNLAYTLPLAVRVKNAGLRFLLDFHYSDTWADPARQTKPAAWTSLTFSQLVQQVHDYSSNCLAAFNAAGARPDYVQVGNEITSGMLWPEGEVGGSYDTQVQWSQLSQLMKAAIQGIREASGAQAPLIIVHIDRGGDWAGTQWFFDHLSQQEVPFDIIGVSYYPFWHGPLDLLMQCLANAPARYSKPVLVAETAFPWTNSVWTNVITGLPSSPDGQIRYLVALAQIVERIPGRRGVGNCWWGAEYQSVDGVKEAGFNTASFFDSGGNVLPLAKGLGQCVAPVYLIGNLNAGILTLNWPLSAAASSLGVATNLAPPVTWLEVTNPVQTTQIEFQVTLPLIPGPCRFYRLLPPLF
jgi:arabinogalactan endo-1,4-beta-galactosidase